MPSTGSYYQKFDEMIYRSLQAADRACRINFSINAILVGVGISLFAYTMIYSALNGLDIYSVGFGSLGLASFITIFFVTPQSRISKSATDFAQILILCRSYVALLDRMDATYDLNKCDLKQAEEYGQIIEKATFRIVEKMEKLVGKNT